MVLELLILEFLLLQKLVQPLCSAGSLIQVGLGFEQVSQPGQLNFLVLDFLLLRPLLVLEPFAPEEYAA